jgi:hypothetical protein
MKFEALKEKKFQTSENADLNKLFGGETTSSQKVTNRPNGGTDAYADADSTGSGGGTSSVSIINGVITFDA